MKNTNPLIYLLILMLVANASLADSYVGPEFIANSDNTFSAYPGSEAQMARTARIWVAFMIDKNGEVFEPMIERINNERFSENVLQWVSLRNYKPATLNGEPVQTLRRQRFGFDITYGERSGRVSTKLFNKHYKAFNSEIERESPNQKKLSKLLKKMWGTKHGSELAYELLSSARYKYAKQFLDHDEQIYALREMILSNDDGIASLNGQIADVELIKLTINGGYYGEVVDSYFDALSNHSSQIDQGLRELFEPTIKQIQEIIQSDKAFARPVKLHPDRSTYIPLKKRRFAFDEVSGELKTLKLRCRHKFAKLEFNPDSEYVLPEKWGACQLEILGVPGASAQLVQF